MKKLSLLVVLFCTSLMVMAQDVIVKKDGSTIQSKVMEISGTEIKYKKWSNQEGPLYSITRDEVYSINYQNGEVEMISSELGEKQMEKQNANQSLLPTNGKMERKGRNLTLNGRELPDEEILSLVGPENYETYLSARKQISVGNVFTPIFWASLGASSILLASAYLFPESHYNPYSGNVYETENMDFLIASLVTGVVAYVSLPLMVIFKSAGKGRMNWVANEYNRNVDSSTISYQLSPSIMKCNPMVSQNNIGLGLTFSLNF